MKIVLKPLGGVESRVLDGLGERVGLVFGCPVVVKPGLKDLSSAYRQSRKQYLARSSWRRWLRRGGKKTSGLWA